MDYTLCSYKSPAYETLLFERTIARLIDLGYPEKLRGLKYNSNFPGKKFLKVYAFLNLIFLVRGLWFDL